MAPTSRPAESEHRLARQTRERFVAALDVCIVELMGKVQSHLGNLVSGGVKASLSEMHLAMEAADTFQRQRNQWVAAVRQGWRESLAAGAGSPRRADPLSGLGLVDDAEVERKILASRLAAAVTDAAGPELNNLKLRIQRLEGAADWASQDALRPETLALLLVKAWTDNGLTRPMWGLTQSALQPLLAERMADAYRAANEFLVEQGVMPEIDMRQLMRRERSSGWDDVPGAPPAPRQGPTPPRAEMPLRPRGDAPMPSRATPSPHRPAEHPMRTQLDGPMSDLGSPPTRGAGAPSAYVRPSALARASQETRMLTGISPIGRMRERAQGVLGQLRRLLSDGVAGYDAGAPAGPPSPQLARELAEPPTPYAVTELLDSLPAGASAPLPAASVQQVATRLRERAAELKAKADKPSEKAIIEIVALMFQAILAEERIPAAVRVWFARLQIPVLRLALAEPDFFASVQHPARQLIDRMGACVLGFDAAQIGGSRLEREIKRIVQVIEQYPETGRRVYQLVLDEFKKFLGRALTEGGAVQQAATLAQQVEQKEALSIQYTIELRRMLDPVPVSEEVREFLFRVWSDVLAMAAVRRGPQHAETLRYKQAAADLVWAVSPRSDRAERGRVVQKLAGVIAVLREGMSSLALAAEEQDGHIKRINDAVMQAFVSRAESIAQTTLDELARALAGMEDVVTDDPEGDLLLDPGMIELMFGVDGDALEVIATGGSQPGEGMLQWARELELGAWFSLDHQGAMSQVQYVWRSQRGQLHLLASGVGKSYLVQTRRLASYLQAGLLVPIEDEALTVRATREALTRLQAEPTQLLH